MRREERTWHESVRASGISCNPYRPNSRSRRF
nr:MAG TPA: hypothetical protein [Caudoviricetes sp.]